MKAQRKNYLIILLLVVAALVSALVAYNVNADKTAKAESDSQVGFYIGNTYGINSGATTTTYAGVEAVYSLNGTGGRYNIQQDRGYFNSNAVDLRVSIEKPREGYTVPNFTWVLFYYKLYKYDGSSWIGGTQTCFATFAANGTKWHAAGKKFVDQVDALAEINYGKKIGEYLKSVRGTDEIEDTRFFYELVTDNTGDDVSLCRIPVDNNATYKIKIWAVALAKVLVANNNQGINVYPCSEEEEFCIDNTAPNLSVSCGDGGYSRSSVVVAYSDASPVSGYYGKSTSSSFPTASPDNTMSSSMTFSDEGNYAVNAVDFAYNSTTKFFTIDKTAPTLSLSGVAEEGVTNSSVRVSWNTTSIGTGKQRSNSDDTLTVKYGYSSTSTYPTSATITLTDSKLFSNEGSYIVKISDRAGNSSTSRFRIDKTAPTVSAPQEYVHTSFVFSATDSYGGVNIEYRKDGTAITTVDSSSFSVALEENNFGAWQFRAFDEAGNYSAWHPVNFFYRPTFGNKNEIYNSFYIPAYYVVNLPAKVYSDIHGKYTFSEYSSALEWATAKEWEYRVVTLNGEKWTYVNIANESVIQVYNDRVELDAAVNKYAASYISERTLMNSSGGSLNNPVDSSGVERDDALTAQLKSLPAHLSEYSGLPYMFIQQTYIFAKPIDGVSGNKPVLTVQYISNGITQEKGTIRQIEYGTSLKSALTAIDEWRQGYYLVTEKDTCGNVEQYILCVDSGEATLIADVTQGDGTSSEIDFDLAFVKNNADIMRYLSVAFVDLFDSLDDYVMLNINGRGIDGTYLAGDEIPVLCYENGYYGSYTLTVYDRSLNVMQFTIQIAGAEPSMSHTSLTNETKCTLTVSANDSNNAITALKLYKVTYTGEYVLQTMDGDGTLINNETLSYVLRTGGKYVMEFTDVFGRTVITDPIFYMKGLPVGTLSGVKDGGLTNGNVALRYDENCSVILYTWQDGSWIMADGLMQIVEGLSDKTASIIAGTDTSYKFKYFLYVSEDMNLFTEYTFEIDCIPPEVNIFDINGGSIIPNTVTPESFYLTWQESGYTAYYYNKKNVLGSLSQDKYTRETRLAQAETYVFEIYDAAKNVTAFEVTLDNVVSWTLESTSYSMLEDGSYISKYYFTLTVTERTSVWQVTSNNGLAPVNGQKIDTDGTYGYHIEDAYGNVLNLVLVIDNLPPTAVIMTDDGACLLSEAKTNRAFTVSCEEENVIITYAAANGTYVAYDGSLIDDAGMYSFKLTDRMGNSLIVTVTIDRDVSYTLGGFFLEQNGIYYSRSYITVTVTEEYSTFTILNSFGVSCNVAAKLDAEGSYAVSITDKAGNTTGFTVIIDKTAPTAIIQTLAGEEVEYGSTLIGAFLVYCEEENTTINYARGAGSYAAYDGSYLSTSGTYHFTVSDFLGNSDTFTVKIDLAVDFTLGGSYVEDDDSNYYAKNWIIVTMNEGYNRLYIESESGRAYSEGDRVSEEGVYNVFIEDTYGNSVQFNIIIDRTAPGITLDGATSGGKTRDNVQIKVEDFVSATYAVGGLKYDFETNQTVTAEGVYTVTATDFVGNVATVSFTIDKSVSVTPSRNLINGQIITGPISFTFDEEVKATLETNGGQTSYVRGNLADAGHYALTVTDALGNIAELEWTIIPAIDRHFEFPVSEAYSVSVLCNENVVTSAVSNGKVTLTESGEYLLTFTGNAGESYELQLTVDTVAPTVQITQGKRHVTISEPSKDGLTYMLYKDGTLTSYKLGDSITDVGSYKLVVCDSLGNSSEYSFNLNYINTAGVLLIVLVCLLIAAVATVIIIVRLKQRIR